MPRLFICSCVAGPGPLSPSSVRLHQTFVDMCAKWPVIAIFFLNGVCYVAISGARSAVLYAWLYTVSAIVAGRLVLNLHSLSTPPVCTSGEDTAVEWHLEETTVVDGNPRATRQWKGKAKVTSSTHSSSSAAIDTPDHDIELGLPRYHPTSSRRPDPPPPPFPRWYNPPTSSRFRPYPDDSWMDEDDNDFDSDSDASIVFAPPVPPKKKQNDQNSGGTPRPEPRLEPAVVVIDDGLGDYEVYEPANEQELIPMPDRMLQDGKPGLNR
jgi:hypothetical protein